MAPRKLALTAALGLAGLVAGCGSSSNNGITQAPSTPQTASAPPAITTPSSGPLSSEPHIARGTGAPPKKLVIRDLIKGTGAPAASGQQLTVNYVGALFSTGKVFDASWNRNQPFQFQLGQGSVIKGWDEGLVGMRIGGRRQLIIPAALAYGAHGSPPTIGPNQALIFDIDLLGAS